MDKIALYNGITQVDPAMVEDAALVPGRKNRILQFVRYAAAAAACAAVLTVGSYQALAKPVTTIYVTINPSVSMELNRVGRIISLNALNDDGAALLEGYSYAGKSRVQVAEELIDRAEQQGFIKENGHVTISVEAVTNAAAEKYTAELSGVLSGKQLPEKNAEIEVRNLLTVRQVKDIVLKHYGLSSASFTAIECEAEHARSIYEVEFTAGGKTYECEMDAETGEILWASTGRAAGDTENAAVALTVAKAKKAALKHAGVSDATFTKAELDEEDGAWVYELKFHTEDSKYEYVVDANSGKVLEFEHEEQKTQKAGASLTVAEAKKAALKHAGVSDATFTKAELDEEDGAWVYELKFYTEDSKYEYVVDANSGKVLEFEHEEQKTQKAAASLTVAEAKKAALKHAGVSDATFTKAELDEEDGAWVYELKFHTEDSEYEYVVDANSGKVLEFEHEEQKTQKASASLTVAEAKKAALKHAGVSDATFTKAELDEEDGAWVYELKFHTEDSEYEYVVDANSGKVLEFECEKERANVSDDEENDKDNEDERKKDKDESDDDDDNDDED